MGVHATRDTASQPTEARLGDVLKGVREQLGLSLRTLATKAGFSPSFISQLEHGQVSPSIASLDRIASELGVTLAELFAASQAPAAVVVRAKARPGFTSTWSRARIESLTPAGERRPIEAVAVTLAPRGASGAHPSTHSTDQFVYVLAGAITLFLGEDRLSLEVGDAVVIPRKSPHRWQNDSSTPAQALLVSVRLFQ